MGNFNHIPIQPILQDHYDKITDKNPKDYQFNGIYFDQSSKMWKLNKIMTNRNSIASKKIKYCLFIIIN